MSKYIDAEVFKTKIMNYGIIYEGDRIPIPFYKEHCGKMFTELLRWVCEEVDDALPADVVEARHGRWGYKPAPQNAMFGFYVCSKCGAASWASSSPYCPNCGAKMVNEDE